MNPLALQDLDNEVLKEADQYLRDHKILELFEVSRFAISKLLFKSLCRCTEECAAAVAVKNGGYLRCAGSDDSSVLQTA